MGLPMQHRMKEFTMDDGAVKALLKKAQYGHISTIGKDGYPYTVAVHFVYLNDKIYFHGLPRGQKLDNISNCPKVCFNVDKLKKVMLEGIESPCTADAEYESVVIIGEAKILDEAELKIKILKEIVKKYISKSPDMPIPEKMIKGTAVVEVDIKSITGKYHK